jgi:hypothetical protein
MQLKSFTTNHIFASCSETINPEQMCTNLTNYIAGRHDGLHYYEVNVKVNFTL